MKKIYTVFPALTAAFFILFFAGISSAAKKDQKKTDEKISVSKSYVKDKKIIIIDDAGKEIEYRIKGMCYAPDTNGDMFCQNYERDIPLIKKAGANSIRTYRPLGCHKTSETFDVKDSKKILDACHKADITVMVGFSYEDMAENGLMEIYLKEFAAHPAIFMIGLGNEYNYHYGDWFSKEEWQERLASAVKRARAYAPDKIIATVHGEMPSQAEYDEYVAAGLDFVLVNMYRGSNFGFSQSHWDEISDTMPWALGEFGRSSKDGEGNDTSNLQASELQSLIRSMKHGYLFTFVDDPGKGGEENSPVIGREDSMGIYDAGRKPKKAVAIVKKEYDNIDGAVYLD